MASHESYYASNNPTTSPLPPRPSSNTTAPPLPPHPSSNTTGPPPPPPPKPGEVSRSSTPSAPPIPPHPNAAQIQSQNHPSARSSPAPPPLPPTPTNASHQGQSQGQYPSQQQQQQQQQQSSQSFPGFQAPAVTAPPLESGWLPNGLKDHSTADLHPLLNNPEQLDAFAKQHPAYKAALEPLQAAVTANLAMAQHVAQLEAQVKQLRDQTGQLLLNHTSLQTQWRRKQSEMDDALSSWGPRAMYSRLVSSINEQEALLRAVHESFVDGGGESHEFYGTGNGKATEKEVTEWVKRIREGTTTLEKRREMRQRWDEGRVGGWR